MKMKQWIKGIDWGSVLVYGFLIAFFCVSVLYGLSSYKNANLKTALEEADKKYTELYESKPTTLMVPIPEGRIINITGEYDSMDDAVSGNTIKYYVTVAFVIYDQDILIALDDQLEESRK